MNIGHKLTCTLSFELNISHLEVLWPSFERDEFVADLCLESKTNCSPVGWIEAIWLWSLDGDESVRQRRIARYVDSDEIGMSIV